MIGAGFFSAQVYGRGYTAPELRPDQMRVRFVHDTSDGVPCVTCHQDGTFTYQLEPGGIWVEKDRTVPQAVLDRQPTDVRNKVMRAMTAAGVVAA